MTQSKAKMLASLNVTREARNAAVEDENKLAELMANPEYLRHSSTIINDALKEGFDVLQLPNGDIVTTGTKTIVNTYVWDESTNRLDKARARKAAGSKARMEEEAAE